MPAIRCPGCRARSDPSEVPGLDWTCPHCGKTLPVTTARVDDRRRPPRLSLLILLGTLITLTCLLSLGAFALVVKYVEHNPEYWTEQQMYAHLRAKGLDPSYQLCEGTLG